MEGGCPLCPASTNDPVTRTEPHSDGQKMIFPLPLTEFETYMLADDRPSHPMVFYLRLEVRGEFERGVFEKALGHVTARHPLLQAVVQGDAPRARFVKADNERPTVRWHSDVDRDVARDARPIDIASEVGLRVIVCQNADRAVVWLVFHHVCCDGLGAVAVANEILAAYREFLDEDVPITDAALPPLREEQLRDRGVFAPSRWQQWLRWPWEILSMIGSLEYFLHRPMPLATTEGDPQSAADDAELASCRCLLDAETTQQVVSRARESDVTVNDLLLRDLFLASHDWLASQQAVSAEGHVRIMVPFNLRTKLHAAMPAANCVSMVNIERRVGRWPDKSRLLKVIGREMYWVKRLRVAATMIRIISAVRLFSGSTRCLQPVDRCLTSCIFSNLGVVMRNQLATQSTRKEVPGSVTLESVELLPPIRPWTGAAVGAATYNGRLAISVLYDRRLMGEQGGEKLLELLVTRLRSAESR